MRDELKIRFRHLRIRALPPGKDDGSPNDHY